MAAALAACNGGAVTSPPDSGTPPSSTTSFAGFDIGVYPGDAAMRAWMRPSSPYFWVGYYLAAPCHRDTTFTGKYTTLTAMGWGVTAIYVGQQDWTQIPTPPPKQPARASIASSAAVCSASLLSVNQGLIEAADAVQKMNADNFLTSSTVFLDVEFVTTVTPALLDYYRAWIRGVLTDGRYIPGVYAAKSNATTLYNAAVAEYRAAGRSDTPPFWIASSAGFSTAAHPTDVGLDFATAWQGMFDVKQSFGGVTLTIDVNVASSKSPSAPQILASTRNAAGT